MQTTVLLITLAGILLISAAFIAVIINASERDENYSDIVQRAYRIRKHWLMALLLLGGIVTVATLTPFPLTASSSAEPRVIKAVGGQWYWQLDADTAQVGEALQFHVSSADVNHGFAVYDPDDLIVGQTQAMPGYTNKLNLTFTKPGTHRIMCLEYCGLAHHAMVVEFKVTEAQP